jgi:hypothetical protein
MRRWWVRRDKDERRRAQPRAGKRVKPRPGRAERRRDPGLSHGAIVQHLASSHRSKLHDRALGTRETHRGARAHPGGNGWTLPAIRPVTCCQPLPAGRVDQ